MRLLLADSFTLTDGVASAAAYAVEEPWPILASFSISLQESDLTVWRGLGYMPTAFEMFYTSSAAPIFTVEQILEPPTAGLAALGFAVLAWCRGRARLATQRRED
jgi:hypothetical protein